MFRKWMKERFHPLTLRNLTTVGLVLLLIVAVPGVTVDTSTGEDDGPASLSPIEALEFWKGEKDRIKSQLPDNDESLLTLPDMPADPYPEVSPDGHPLGFNPPDSQGTSIWDNLSSPPFNTGGGYSRDTLSSLGEYQVGGTHEYWIGDQNGNGILEWVVYYFYRPNSINGLDDDGDGCIDEPTSGLSTGQTGCDMIPDAMVYFDTGRYPILGGSGGDLVIFQDLYDVQPSLKIFRIGVTARWMSYEYRGHIINPQLVGDFVSYYSHEGLFGVNSNPEMDDDFSDYFVGSLDLRWFPSRPPVNHVCSAGEQPYSGATYLRDDGWIVGSYNLVEWFDDQDWNGDGDNTDRVAAYYAINPTTGSCRQGVNAGVYGYYPLNRGTIMIPLLTSEAMDKRDWNGDGDAFDFVLLYHDINSTWQLKGRIYRSTTFTAAVPSWGWGWWAMYSSYIQYKFYPLEFGGVIEHREPFYYKTLFWLADDEDGDRHTVLPTYEVGYGRPAGTIGGRCVIMSTIELYIAYDVTMDGDMWDTVNGVFCPNETGGGGIWVSKGPVIGTTQLPYAFQGFVSLRYSDYVVEDSQGRVAVPFFVNELGTYGGAHVDLDGDNVTSNVWIHLSYLFKMP